MIVAKKEHNDRLAKRELMLIIAIHWAIIGKNTLKEAYLLMVLPMMAPPCSMQKGDTSVPPPPKLTRKGARPLIIICSPVLPLHLL